MLGGYTGKSLQVDLEKRSFQVVPTEEFQVRSVLGGKGLGAMALFNRLKRGVDPLSPENLLIFATGPLTGTLTPAACKYTVVTRSPLTGTFLDSHSGGFFGPELKFAGYDTLILQGRAEKLSYLVVDPENPRLVDAAHLRGKSSYLVESMLRDELGDPSVRISSVGPAGENLVRFACITNDYGRQAGRGGGGAVMGSKNLKAVAVRGGRAVNLADPEAFLAVFKRCYDKEIASSGYKYMCTTGTTTGMSVYSEEGVFPSYNFGSGTFSGISRIDDARLAESFTRKNKACSGCPARCGRFVSIDAGNLVGPEYETVALLGGNCGIDDPEAIVKANILCDELGMDTMSAGVVVSFAMECFERGVLNKTDFDGLEPRFGNASAALELLGMISDRKGIGDLLAEGSKRAGESIGAGAEDLAMHVKGMELAGYEPRGLFALSLAYATSDRGGCHLRASTADAELSGAYGNRLDPASYVEGKGMLIKGMQDEKAWKDSIGVCKFMALGSQDYAELLCAATGWTVPADELQLIGERVYNLTRAFNASEGFAKPHDTLPRRMLEEPIPDGKTKGMRISPQYLDRMLGDYYSVRGWDESGIPTRETLERLGLDSCVSSQRWEGVGSR